MICEQAIERLPWLLNGSLEAAEQEEVQGHLKTCEACRRALAETREAWTIFGQHLPSATLVSIAYGEPPEGIDSALAERHLASCPECAAELELARMSRRLEDDRIAPFPVRPDRDTRKEHRIWRNAALAAGLAGLVAFTGWFQAAQRSRLVPELQQRQAELAAGVKQTQDELAQITQPQLNARVPDLRPDEVTRGGSTEILVPAGRDVAVLLQPGHDTTSLDRSLAILDETGKTVWESPGLHLDEALQEFTFRTGLILKTPGRYTIQLYETVNGQKVPREKYSIRVQ